MINHVDGHTSRENFFSTSELLQRHPEFTRVMFPPLIDHLP